MKKKSLFILVILVIMFIPLVNAKSDYYNYVWTNDASDDVYTINDALETDDGYIITIGYVRGYDQNTGSQYGMDRALIRKLDSKGNLVKSVSVDGIGSKLKKIVKSGDYYYVFGSSEFGVAVVKLSSDLEVEDTQIVQTSTSYDQMEMYVVESDNYYYIIEPACASEYVVQVKKDGSGAGEIAYSSLSSDIKSIADIYIKAFDLKDTDEDDYYPSFIKEYQGGYLYYVFNFTDWDSYLVYYKDGKQVWEKALDNMFYRDAVEINGNIYLITEDLTGEYISYITILDSEGNELSNDSLSAYVDAESDDSIGFGPEHIISLNSGFLVTGLSWDSNDMWTQNSLYFSYIYSVETKTDGHGTITASKNIASSGDEVTFTITPEKGYVLGIVKVTDSDGNVVTFTSNTFTMPSANVTIEATFVVENPNTKSVIMISMIGLGIMTGLMFVQLRKKIKFLK